MNPGPIRSIVPFNRDRVGNIAALGKQRSRFTLISIPQSKGVSTRWHFDSLEKAIETAKDMLKKSAKKNQPTPILHITDNGLRCVVWKSQPSEQ